MKVIIRSTASEASAYIAEHIIHRVNTFTSTESHPKFVLGLPTGSSPEQIYAYLVSAHRAHRISFVNVITFNMDEYVGLPEEHPESYHSFMYKHFFAHIDIDPANVNILNGNAPDLAAECESYEARMRAAGGIDLFLGGVGPDGHIAFNEPGSSLTSRTRVKTLAEDTIRANSRFFNNDLSLVPKQALTVGVGTVMDSREVCLIVLGANKAMALQKTIEGGVSQMWTASCLQMHPNAMIGCDDAATEEMLVKTVKVGALDLTQVLGTVANEHQYFKSIEQVAEHTVTTPPMQARATKPTTHSPMPLTPPHSAEKPAGPAPGTWRGALKELRIDTQKSNELEDDDLELTPDSMSARVAASETVDSAIGMSPPNDQRGSIVMSERKLPPVRKSTIDGLDFSSMSRRVSGKA
jgi:glucosamine-6-phosphate deaminase